MPRPADTTDSAAAAAPTPTPVPVGAPATDTPAPPAGNPADRRGDAPKTAVTSDTLNPSAKADYTVAPGRTVSNGDGDDVEHKVAGETVSLEPKDAKRLLDAGFILAPDGSIVVHADGPAVNVENGVQISQPA